MWYVYILSCVDKTYYTGITNNLAERVRKHNSGNGAIYTRGRIPVSLVYSEIKKSHSLAAKREVEIKKMSRKKKEKLIASVKKD